MVSEATTQLKKRIIEIMIKRETRVAILAVALLVGKIIIEERGIEVGNTLDNILTLWAWYAVVKLWVLLSTEKEKKRWVEQK